MKLSKRSLGIVESKPTPPPPEKIVEVREVKVPAVEQKAIVAAVNSSLNAKLGVFTDEINTAIEKINTTIQDVIGIVNKEKPKKEWILKVKRDGNSLIDYVKVLEM